MTKELMIPKDLKPEIFFDKQKIQEIISDIRKRVADFKGDISTEEGRKEITSFAYAITRSKTAIDDMGKEYVAELKQKPKLVDAARKVIRDELDSLKEQARKPLTDWENAEKLRVSQLENHLLMLITLGDQSKEGWSGLSIEEHKESLQILTNAKECDWQEYKERANQVINDALEKINQAISKRESYDKEQAELEILRKEKAERERIEYEEKIKAEAAENARIETEQRLKAEQDKLAAEQEFKRKEQEKVEKEKAERENDKNHQKKVRQEVLKALEALQVESHLAESIIDEICKGHIPHISIQY